MNEETSNTLHTALHDALEINRDNTSSFAFVNRIWDAIHGATDPEISNNHAPEINALVMEHFIDLVDRRDDPLHSPYLMDIAEIKVVDSILDVLDSPSPQREIKITPQLEPDWDYTLPSFITAPYSENK